MNILWICDEEGWAYDGVAKMMSAGMPEHRHTIFYSKLHLPQAILWFEADLADVIVCCHPAQIAWLKDSQKDKAVLRLATRPFKMYRPRVCWLCDQPGWAYERRAKLLIKSLDRFDHTILYYWSYATDKERTVAVAGFDAIICMCVAYTQLVANKKRAIGCVGGLRLLYETERIKC